MKEFARHQAAVLLRRLAFQVNRAVKVNDSDAVHDLRVAMRRLSRCLKVFEQFFPASGKRMRRKLSGLMDLAAEVRDRDIALELLAAAGFSGSTAIAARLRRDRKKARRELITEIRQWRQRDVSQKWRRKLDL